MLKLLNVFVDYPENLIIDIAGPIDSVVDWIDKTFRGLLDAFVVFFTFLLDNVQEFLLIVPWWVYILLVGVLGWRLYKWPTGVGLGVLVFAIGLLGHWEGTMYTLTIILVSVMISFVVGLPTGILMAKFKKFEMVLKPILDMMQTLPSFVYLIPALMLFNTFGRVPAVVATTIYSLPPLIRLTYLGIKNVDEQIVEAGTSFGSTSMQMLLKIQLPQSLSTIAAGVNQTTMMAVAMVVIASMIGARGVGNDVLRAIEQLAVGEGFSAGFAIVFLAIILDRILQGVANKFDMTAQEGEDA